MDVKCRYLPGTEFSMSKIQAMSIITQIGFQEFSKIILSGFSSSWYTEVYASAGKSREPGREKLLQQPGTAFHSLS